MNNHVLMAVRDRINFLRFTAKPFNIFVALTSKNGRRYELLYLTFLTKLPIDTASKAIVVLKQI